MLLGELVNSLAKMAGIEEKDENLTKLLAVKEVATAEVADDLSTAIQSKLMTTEAAMNNPEIVNKLKAESLNAVDDKLGTLAKDIFKFDDAFVESLKTTKGTYNRMDLFVKQISETHAAAIKTLEEAKEGTGDPKAKAELQLQIDGLNGELATLKESTVSSADHQNTVDGYEEKILKLHKKGLFSNYNYIKTIERDVAEIAGISYFDNELIKRGVTLVNKEGVLSFETKEGTKYFDDKNKEVTPKELADGLLAEHKLLEVNGDPIPTPTPSPTDTPISTPVNGAVDNTEAVRIASEHVGSLQTLGEAQPA